MEARRREDRRKRSGIQGSEQRSTAEGAGGPCASTTKHTILWGFFFKKKWKLRFHAHTICGGDVRADVSVYHHTQHEPMLAVTTDANGYKSAGFYYPKLMSMNIKFVR